MVKKIVTTILLLTTLIGLGLALHYLKKQHEESLCRGLLVEVINPNEDNLLMTEKQVKRMIESDFDSLTYRKIKEIPVKEITKKLYQNPLIASCDVIRTLNYFLKIRIKIFEPVVRITTTTGQSLYITSDRKMIPVIPGSPSRVMIASGNIKINIPDSLLFKNHELLDTKEYNQIAEITNLAIRLQQNRFLSEQIGQIFVNDKEEYELIPTIGNQVIIFGKYQHVQQKIRKLVAFYEQALPAEGWQKYKSINLKYKNQIVCSKI